MVRRVRLLTYSGIAAVVLLCSPPSSVIPGQTAIDCATMPQWTNQASRPQVNQVHIFCGERRSNAPRGFHSRPAGLTPATVGRFTVTQRANAQGIYGGTWHYRGHPHPVKFSTMFPDSCSQEEVLNSITHAASHPIACPSGAPTWAVCGTNRPDPVPPDAGPFCDAANGTLFTVAMAVHSGGKVNTAFPLR